MPAIPGASREVRVREWSVMHASFLHTRNKCNSDRAVEAVSGIPQARNDVADLVELLLEGAQHDGDLAAPCRLLPALDPLRRADQADGCDIHAPAGEEIVDRGNQ